MKRIAFLVLLCLCLILGACFATALADNIEIANAADLWFFANKCESEDYAGQKVVLTADIDLGGATWTPIKSFAGEFAGNNHTISNFTIGTRDDTNHQGFFCSLESTSNVHELTLSNVTATVSGWYGTLSEIIYGDVSNVYVKNVNVTVNNADARVGGMCGFLQCNHVHDSRVENLTVTAPNGANHIAGFSAIFYNTKSTVTNNQVINFRATVNNLGSGSVAGFICSTEGEDSANLSSCYVNQINLTVSGSASGNSFVAGFLCRPGVLSRISNCGVNGGTINVSGLTGQNKDNSYVGGFLADLGDARYANRVYDINNCHTTVNITTNQITAGGFIGSATHEKNYDMYVKFSMCDVEGNVTCVPGGTATVGGFAGVADRGNYFHCKALGLVSGSVAGGFIGTVKDVIPEYSDVFSSTGWGYPVNKIELSQCSTRKNGQEVTVLGTQKAGGLIGLVEESLHGTAANGADGELIISDCTTARAVIGATKSTETAYYLNSVPDSKTIRMTGESGHRTIIIPTDANATLSIDENGNVVIPEGGADVLYQDDPELTWIPAGSILHQDGSITLPTPGGGDEGKGDEGKGDEGKGDEGEGEEGEAEIITTPPQTGVNGVEGYALLAALSLLCMAVLVALRRRERHS